MERDTYNVPFQRCVSTLSGPICPICPNCSQNSFLGNSIYSQKSRTEDNFCDERHTYIDCKGYVKFTLPLSDYDKVPRKK